MVQVRTMNEIKLQREFLKKQLAAQEDHMKLHSEEIVQETKRYIVKKVIEKGIVMLVKYFMERKQARQEKAGDD